MLGIMIGHVLRNARLAAGLTLRALAEQVPMSYSALSEMERGIKPPTSETVWGICQALEISMSSVLTEAADLIEAEERRGNVA